MQFSNFIYNIEITFQTTLPAVLYLATVPLAFQPTTNQTEQATL